MNKKVIAAAVSAAILAPVAAQADVTVYGRVNNAVSFSDSPNATSSGANPNRENRTDVSGASSRFGIKASSDLGNGLTASAQYEFAVVSDKETGASGAVGDVRIAKVGLSGGFGSVDIGNQWSAFYNMVGTFIDPTYTLGAILYSTFAGGAYRQSNAIKYSNSFGPVNLELDVRLNDSNEAGDVAEKLNGNGAGLGLQFAVTDNLTLAAAYDSETTKNSSSVKTADVDRTGVAAKVAVNNFDVSLGWHETDTNYTNAVAAADKKEQQTQLWLGYNFTDQARGTLGYGEGERDTVGSTSVDVNAVGLGFYYNMGGGLKLYYEGIRYANDTANTDFNTNLIGMRYDF